MPSQVGAVAGQGKGDGNAKGQHVFVTRQPSNSSGIVTLAEFVNPQDGQEQTFTLAADSTISIGLGETAQSAAGSQIFIMVAKDFSFRLDLGAGLVTSYLGQNTGYSVERESDGTATGHVSRIYADRTDWRIDTSFNAGFSFLFRENPSKYRFLDYLGDIASLGLFSRGRNRIGVSAGTVVRGTGDAQNAYYVGFSIFGDRDGNAALSYGAMFQPYARLRNGRIGETVSDDFAVSVEQRYRPTFFIGLFYRVDPVKK